MYVTKHQKRFLINMSHAEMAVMRKVFSAGLLLLEAEEDGGLMDGFDRYEKMALGRWRQHDPLQETGPREDRPKPKPRRAKALSSVT